MKNAILILAILILQIIQNSILIPLQIFPVNLILIFLVAAVLFSDFNEGLLVALIGGILLDLISGTPDGFISLAMIAIFLGLYFILNYLLARESNRIVLFCSVAGATILLWLAQSLVGRSLIWTDLPLMLVWNLLFTYPVLKYYVWIHSKLKTKVSAG